jgi:hypothetical protein
LILTDSSRAIDTISPNRELSDSITVNQAQRPAGELLEAIGEAILPQLETTQLTARVDQAASIASVRPGERE